MTRLIESWIRDISSSIRDYEKELMVKTGWDFTALASAAGGVSVERISQASELTKVAVVPITQGMGIIGSFAQSVAAIVQSMHFEAFVTGTTDVDGIFEAHRKGAGIIFMADDARFIAMNLVTNTVAENSNATAKGFVAALEGAARGLAGREVLVIGCGVVGCDVLEMLKQKGALPVVYDINEAVLAKMEQAGIVIIKNVEQIRNYELIIDASSTGGWLKKEMLHPAAWYVTPGVPLSLDEEAYQSHKDRVIHDYLPIGVATMLAMACK